MSLAAIVVAFALAQAAPIPSYPESSDVAYAELTRGDAGAAVHKLERVAMQGDDPAVLINLGTAYARQGMTDKALATFRAASISPVRYDLELADGTWMDSREVARIALVGLQLRIAQAQR